MRPGRLSPFLGLAALPAAGTTLLLVAGPTGLAAGTVAAIAMAPACLAWYRRADTGIAGPE